MERERKKEERKKKKEKRRKKATANGREICVVEKDKAQKSQCKNDYDGKDEKTLYYHSFFLFFCGQNHRKFA